MIKRLLCRIFGHKWYLLRMKHGISYSFNNHHYCDRCGVIVKYYPAQDKYIILDVKMEKKWTYKGIME